MSGDLRREGVGPVLEACDASLAVIAAIREAHPDVDVVDRGAYFRVSVPRVCSVTRESIERHAHGPFHLPSDLDRIMPSFAGHLTMTDDDVRWELRGHASGSGTPLIREKP